MSYDLAQQFIEFRKQITNKIKTVPQINASKISTVSTPQKKQEFSVDILKQSICQNAKRLKVKSAISNIPLSPQKQQSPNKTILKSPLRMKNETLKSPNRQVYHSTSKSQQSLTQNPQSQRQIQRDYVDQQSQIKLYASKYQKVMGDEQGLYYGQLQTKLDQLAEIIGHQDDSKKYLLEIDNVISQQKQINAKSKVQRHLDSLQYESKALQSDLTSLRTKISRFTDFTDN